MALAEALAALGVGEALGSVGEGTRVALTVGDEVLVARVVAVGSFVETGCLVGASVGCGVGVTVGLGPLFGLPRVAFERY